MATFVTDLSTLQSSDYSSSDYSLQDYSDLSNLGLQAPAMDTPLGVDPFTGASIYDGNPADPSLTVIGTPAGDGTNLYNDGLLPLSNPNPSDDSVLASSQQAGLTQVTPSGSNDLALMGNLPLTSANTILDTALGSPTVKPVVNSQPMGASLWASLFGTSASAAVGAVKAGTAGAPLKTSLPGAVKAAPFTATTNPIPKTTTFLVVGALAGFAGLLIWVGTR